MGKNEPGKPVRMAQTYNKIPKDTKSQSAQPHVIDLRSAQYKTTCPCVKGFRFHSAIEGGYAWAQPLEETHSAILVVTHQEKIIIYLFQLDFPSSKEVYEAL